jgi:hypothetical protein
MTKAGVAASFAGALVFVLGRFILGTTRLLPVRLAVLLVFVLPVVYAGYSMTLQSSEIGIPSHVWPLTRNASPKARERYQEQLEDMLTHEVFSRDLRDRRAVARYAGLTGSPDESGRRRREKGLAKAGSARVSRGMIQFAWRFLIHQKDSALARGIGRASPPARSARPWS